MGAIKKRNVAKIQTSYAKQQEVAEISGNIKRKRLFRRLTVFFIGAAVLSVFMISTLVSQSSVLDEKRAEKKKLDQELALLKKQEVMLEEEIVKLNDDEYISKLARKDYFLSENGEVIFNIPENKEKNDKKGKSTN
ncbi:septum formation initiator family protein [Cytobacillus solani]|uniref:Cell division protein DIVIC n=1 Tax=Cytobacillus solani TaxID=1637975 RepID=A0A0Q3RAZ7_9BACI|nr:septum formation initiator family protein [Cytobacillus solani]KOP70384.1 cell division protein DIVIC [Bacillus sp. FJAT-21945]KQL27406.1 cell division protein DIVIC [Cytobacillus solani]USK55121.1 septum formation initiator family protein [Cytobacillus solani]